MHCIMNRLDERIVGRLESRDENCKHWQYVVALVIGMQPVPLNFPLGVRRFLDVVEDLKLHEICLTHIKNN